MTGERKWEVGGSNDERHHWFLWRSGDTKVEFRTDSGEPTTSPKERKVYRTKREAQQVARELNAESLIHAKEIPSIRIVRHVFIAFHGTDSCVSGTLDGVTCLKPKSDPIHIQKEEELQMITTPSPVQIVDTRTMAEAAAEATHLMMRWSLIQTRRLHGLTVETVAERMGRSPEDVIREMELPDSDPTLGTLRRYALAVGAITRYEVYEALTEPEEAN